MIFQKLFVKQTIPIFIQCANAHRKPRWLPVAKSKIYRIPKRPVITEDERLELSRINNNYKTQMRAIKRFFYEEMIKEKSTLKSATSEMSQKLEAEEWKRCVQLNTEWNAKIAALREERRVKELAQMEKEALSIMDKEDHNLKISIEKASAEIRLQKELSPTFITLENLDEAIDQALANPVDYNFAIDLKGQKYTGQKAQAVSLEKENRTINAT